MMQYYSLNYLDFLNSNNTNNNLNNADKENKKLKNELNIYKKENEKLKNKIKILSDENKNLNQEIIKLNKIISNYSQNNQQGYTNNTINNLNEIIKTKEKEINELKLQIQKNNKKSVDFDDILYVHFISIDQTINCPIKCLKTDTFAEVEEKLYQKYEKYRETNNNFITKGKVVLRFKKIFENNIKDGDKVELINIQ